MKKLVSSVLVLCMIAVALAGCGNKSTETKRQQKRQHQQSQQFPQKQYLRHRQLRAKQQLFRCILQPA